MSSTKYGQYQVAEPPSSLLRLHRHDGRQLQTVDHPPSIPVLDQENLIEQGMDTSTLIPGARKVGALGSCEANATTAALAATLSPQRVAELGLGVSAVTDEEFAISLYHQLTDLTGDPAKEWPPADCGSSGLYACQYLEQKQIISGHEIAHGPEDILSLMQTGGLIVGQPFLNAWEEPGPDHFIDGDGSAATLEEQIRGGVAGGHETYWRAIVDIKRDLLGRIDPFKTIIRMRNSWSTSWADGGEAYLHLSTYVALGHFCDFRQLNP